MEKNQSMTINYLKFIMTLAVLVLHAYTVVQSVEWLQTRHPIYKFFSSNFSLLFGQIAVPFFFFLSGYLFYFQGKPDYWRKLKVRVHTLIIPYFLWNLITLFIFFVFQHISFTKGMFSGYHKLISEYSWEDFLRAFWDCGDWANGDGRPLLFIYWYIRNLIVLVLISPLFYWLNKYLKYYWLMIPGLFWLLTPNMALTACSVFNFGLGAYMGMHRYDLKLSGRSFKIVLGGYIVLIGLLNFFWYFSVPRVLPVAVLRIFILCSIPVFYTLVYRKVVAGWRISRLWLSSTFFVYSFHIFVMMVLRKGMVKLWPEASDGWSVFFYFSSIIITFFISIGVYWAMRRYMPRVLAVLCGDRC